MTLQGTISTWHECEPRLRSRKQQIKTLQIDSDTVKKRLKKQIIITKYLFFAQLVRRKGLLQKGKPSWNSFQEWRHPQFIASLDLDNFSQSFPIQIWRVVPVVLKMADEMR